MQREPGADGTDVPDFLLPYIDEHVQSMERPQAPPKPQGGKQQRVPWQKVQSKAQLAKQKGPVAATIHTLYSQQLRCARLERAPAAAIEYFLHVHFAMLVCFVTCIAFCP